MTDPTPSPSVPWWRIKVLWLVVGGPAAVVVAATATAVIAVRGSDPVVTTPAVAKSADAAQLSSAPALQARNHAAAAAAR
jgi:hypothetical protein